MDNNPLLSIVITSYTIRRLDDIHKLLDSIAAQSYAAIETIFVVEHSRELEDDITIFTFSDDIWEDYFEFSSMCFTCFPTYDRFSANIILTD